jgi:hypothetical protein
VEKFSDCCQWYPSTNSSAAFANPKYLTDILPFLMRKIPTKPNKYQISIYSIVGAMGIKIQRSLYI